MISQHNVFPFLLFFLLLSFGCVQIPDTLHLEGNQEDFVASNSPVSCLETPSQPDIREKLDSRAFSLLTWNIYKVRLEGWSKDLDDLTRTCDILTLQEGYITEELQTFLENKNFHWNLVSAFTYNDISAGVLTASKVVPDLLCSFREAEPLLRIPKTALITRYPISGTSKKLMVVNIHSVNFSFEHISFQAQLEALAEILASHEGPLVLAGDFNTWSVERLAIVDNFGTRFGMKRVDFSEEYLTKTFGNPIDHIYFRGLTLIESKTGKVASSDHNPLRVTFSFSGAVYK